jgi:hypothetical protein
MYMDYKSLLKWIKSAKPDEIAGTIYDLIDQVQYLEDAQYFTPSEYDQDERLDRTPYAY